MSIMHILCIYNKYGCLMLLVCMCALRTDHLVWHNQLVCSSWREIFSPFSDFLSCLFAVLCKRVEPCEFPPLLC